MLLSLGAFTVAAALIVLLPGPDTLVVLRNLVRGGRAGAVRIAGAIYLLWLGIQSWRARGVQSEPLTAPGRRSLLGTGYPAGVATDLLNPKVGVFFVTFLPGFVPGGYSVGWVSLLLGAIFVVLTAGYFTVLIAVSGRITGWLMSVRIRQRIERATGLVLIGFGLRLGLES